MNFVKLSNREAKWDNVKCLMIFCVVIGHVIYRYLDSDVLARSIYFFIYTFHMPVFVFLSGLFSKKAIKEHQYEKVLLYLLIYVVMKFSQAFVTSLKSGKMAFRFFWESGPGWYALAMAVYFFASFLLESYLTNYNKKKLLVLALFIGIFWGFDDHMGDHFCSARILNFYPFFVLGNYIESKQLMKYMRKWQMKLLSICVLAFTLWVSFVKVDSVYWMLKLLKGKYPFSDMGIDTWEAACIRFLYYIVVSIIGLSIMTLISERKTIFTCIGKRTLSVFIWHTAVIILILDVFHGQEFLSKAWPIHYIQGFILFACVIVILCASMPFVKMTQLIQYVTQVKRNSQVTDY